MGFFSDLFGSIARDALEEGLVRFYGADLVSRAKIEVTRRAMDKEPPNCGNWLLAHESSDSNVRAYLAAVRADGATDADIRWWWNLTPIERVLLEMSGDAARYATFAASRHAGMAPDEAATQVRKAHSIFGDPREGVGDDRPLPVELTKRIVEFTERFYPHLEALRQLRRGASSFNAVVRAEIRRGRL